MQQWPRTASLKTAQLCGTLQLTTYVYMLLPANRAPSFEEAMRYGTDTYHTLRAIIQKKYGEEQEAPEAS